MTKAKTIIYPLSNDYFFCHFKPVYEVLKKDRRLNVFFMYRYKFVFPVYGHYDKKDVIDYLGKNVEKRFIVPDFYESFSPDLIISSEMHPTFEFPERYNSVKKMQIYHGVGIYNFFEAMPNLTRYDVHCAVGPQYAPYLNELRRHRPDVRVYNTGFPKTDELFNHKPKPAGDKKVIVYSAHWSEHASLQRFDEDIINTMCGVPNAEVWVRPHNHLFVETEKDWKGKFSALTTKHHNLRVIYDPDNCESYRQADIVVTDISSTATLEASILGLPVVVFDNQEWFHGKSHTSIERMVLDVAIRFNSLNGLTQSLTAIIEGRMDTVLQDKRNKQKQVVSESLYSPGHATENVVEVIMKEIGL